MFLACIAADPSATACHYTETEMRLLVMDVETTGLLDIKHPAPDLIEVAAALYCTVSRTVLASVQFILPNNGENAAHHINGIYPLALKQPKIEGMEEAFLSMFKQSHYVITHNTQFDQYFVYRRYPELVNTKQWICSCLELKFPKTKRSRVLSHIAIDHGIAPTQMHRAAGDVETLVELLKKCPDLEEQICKLNSQRDLMSCWLNKPLTTKK